MPAHHRAAPNTVHSPQSTEATVSPVPRATEATVPTRPPIPSEATVSSIRRATEATVSSIRRATEATVSTPSGRASEATVPSVPRERSHRASCGQCAIECGQCVVGKGLPPAAFSHSIHGFAPTRSAAWRDHRDRAVVPRSSATPRRTAGSRCVGSLRMLRMLVDPFPPDQSLVHRVEAHR